MRPFYTIDDLSKQAKQIAIKQFIESIKEELLQEKLIDQELFNNKAFNERLFKVYEDKSVQLLTAAGMLFSKEGYVLPETLTDIEAGFDSEAYNRFIRSME